MAFDLQYYNRYNTRIFTSAQIVGGTAATGAISDIVSDDLSPGYVLVSSSGGKIVVSTGQSSKISNINDTTGPIQASIDAKEDALTKGDLTEVTSSVLTITGGSSAVIGSGLTIQVKQATGAQSGYLSLTDWGTFNSKMSSSLADGAIWIGDGGGAAQPNVMSGDVTISNLGVTAIGAGKVTNTMIAAATGISRSKLEALTASRALVTDGSGFDSVSAVTSTELGLLSGLTGSALQTQLAGKLSATVTSAAAGDIIYYNGSSWVNLARGTNGYVLKSTAGSIDWEAGTANGQPAGGTAGQYLNKIDGTDYNSQWSTLTLAKVTDVTATASQVNVLNTGYYDATSSIQTQLNLKLSSALAYHYMFVGNISNVATALATGADGTVLTSVGGVPTWSTPGTGGTVTSVDVSGGTTGLTFTGGAVTTSGTITMAGTLALANGGTGAALSDPGANTLMGWDDTDNAVKFLTIGNGFTYTHASHTLDVGGTITSDLYFTFSGGGVNFGILGNEATVLVGSDVTGNKNYIKLEGGDSASSDYARFIIDLENVSSLGTGVIFQDGRASLKGIEYGATGYVTQLHSLTDKEYVDSVAGIDILTCDVTIATADILTCHTTPVELVAAPGAGKIIRVIGQIVMKYIYGSAAFATNTNAQILHGSSSIFTTLGGVINQTSDYYGSFGSPQWIGAATTIENKSVNFSTQTGDPTSGTGSTVHIIFKYVIETL